MKAVIRDDIIALESYVAAEFKYKVYLEMLNEAGNYCYLNQFKKLIQSGQAIINGMIKNNLIATANINKNYKFIYLTDTAMKYLYLRDSEIDFSGVEKNKISVKKVTKYPSEKQLLSSAYKFHLIASGESKVDKASVLNGIEEFIFMKNLKVSYFQYKEYINRCEKVIAEGNKEIERLNGRINEIRNIIEEITNGTDIFNNEPEKIEIQNLDEKYNEINEMIKVKENSVFKGGVKELYEKADSINLRKGEIEKYLKMKREAINNYNNYISMIEKSRTGIEDKIKVYKEKVNKVNKSVNEITIPRINKAQNVFKKLYDITKVIVRINDDILEFLILDTGNLKTAKGYLKKINEIQQLDIGYKKIKIYIYSYSEYRAKNLYNDFLNIKKKG